MSADKSSNLEPLLADWGVQYNPRQVIADAKQAMSVSLHENEAPSRHYGILGLDQSNFNHSDVVTAGLSSVNVAMSGYLKPDKAATTRFEPLLLSSNQAQPLATERFAMLFDPGALRDGFHATGERYVIGARVTGNIKTAYPGGPPAGVTLPPGTTALKASAKPLELIVFPDVDMLADYLWVRQQNLFEEVLLPYPQIIREHVDVGEHDELQRLCRGLERRGAGRQRDARGRSARICSLDVAGDARADDVTLAGGVESIAQRAGIKQHCEALGRERLRLIAREQQRLEAGGRSLVRLQVAAHRDIDARQARRHHIGVVEVRLVESEDAVVPRRRFILVQRDRHGLLCIGDHLTRIVLHAPVGEQRLQVRGLVGTHCLHGILRIHARGVGLGDRIDEQSDVAAL